ncbi:MAG TPA: phage holin family protein [Verrucomicrobiae bacterium]|nr:phage holin family protein [Verrucomicrobiae bacterium]
MKAFLQRWLINTLAVLVAVYLVDGIKYSKPLDLCVASLLLGILNALLRPVLLVLSLPLVIFSLGLFMLVINGLVLYLVGYLLKPHFYVTTFGAAFWGALVISLVSLILNSLTRSGDSQVEVKWGKGRPNDKKRDDDDKNGGGTIIDV